MPSSIPKARWQFRLMTLMAAVTLAAVPLGLYASYLQRVRRQEAAFRQILAKGGTVFHSESGTYVDFSVRSKPQGLGCYCWNERVLCPDYRISPSFGDPDIGVLKNVISLRNVDFTGSNVSKTAAFEFSDTHPRCSMGYNSVTY